MGTILIILVIFLFFSGFVAPFHIGGLHMESPFAMIVAIVAIVMFTGLIREAIKRRHDSAASQKDLEEIKRHIAQIEADIADIKEQIADFIIKTN